MYKIKNMSGNILCVSLEKGSIMLSPGQAIDLDGICSRKWIRNEMSEIKHLLNIGQIKLLHDSELRIPNQPIHNIAEQAAVIKKGKQFVPPEKIAKPEIIDFSDLADFDDVEDDDDDIEQFLADEEKKSQGLIKEVETEEETKKRHKKEKNEKVKDMFRPSEVTCEVCGKICKSVMGLRSHMRAHKRKEEDKKDENQG